MWFRWSTRRSGASTPSTRQAHRNRSRQAIFDQIHTLREAGTFIGDIAARQTGFGPRSIRKWLQFSTPPGATRAAAPKTLLAQLFPRLSARAVGRKGAFAAESCSTRSSSAAIPAASPIWNGFWRSGCRANDAQSRNVASGSRSQRQRRQRRSRRSPAPSIPRPGGRSRQSSPLRYASSRVVC